MPKISVTGTREAFDPGDPYNAMCESFRMQIVNMVLSAERIAIYRDLTPDQQLSAFTAGALTAVIGVCFASIRDEARGMMMKAIKQALPMARQQAEDILTNGQADASGEG